MELFVTGIGLVLVVFVATWVSWPLLQPQAPAREHAGPAGLELLERQKNQALAAIREVEFDQRTGKLSDEDYQTMRRDLETRAMDAIQAIDAATGSDDTTTTGSAAGGGFCHGCGTALTDGIEFCATCGTARA